MIITTRSGAIYTISNGLWSKNYGLPEKIWSMHCLHEEDLVRFAEQESYDELPIQVGKKMFISGPDSWWLSTPIVSIEKEDGDE